MQIKQEHLCTAGRAVAGLGWLAGQALHSPDIKHAHAGSAQPGSGAQPGPASHWQPITPLSIRGFWDSALLITCSGWIWIGLSESDGSPFGGSYRAVRVGVWHPKRTDLIPISSSTRKSGLVDQQDGLCWSEIVKCVQDRGSWAV